MDNLLMPAWLQTGIMENVSKNSFSIFIFVKFDCWIIRVSGCKSLRRLNKANRYN